MKMEVGKWELIGPRTTVIMSMRRIYMSDIVRKISI